MGSVKEIKLFCRIPDVVCRIGREAWMAGLKTTPLWGDWIPWRTKRRCRGR
ncbi:MAG: hypothetical protein ABSF98_13425 [Bryobacteraceae bacterium]